jgi:predicted XRE-type DNA-binding protein
MKHAFDIDIESLGESKGVTDEREILKYKLSAKFLELTDHMSNQEIITKTGIHKSDLSRFKCMDISRFSIDKIVTLLGRLGFSINITVEQKKVS